MLNLSRRSLVTSAAALPVLALFGRWRLLPSLTGYLARLRIDKMYTCLHARQVAGTSTSRSIVSSSV
jgi:hypothetical protein